MRILHRNYNTLNTHTHRIRQLEKHINIERERGGGGRGRGKGRELPDGLRWFQAEFRLASLSCTLEFLKKPICENFLQFLDFECKKDNFFAVETCSNKPISPFQLSFLFLFSNSSHTRMCSTQLLKARRRYTVRGKGNFVI